MGATIGDWQNIHFDSGHSCSLSSYDSSHAPVRTNEALHAVARPRLRAVDERGAYWKTLLR